MRPPRRVLAISLAAILYACASPNASAPSPTPSSTAVAAGGIHKIQHVVVIMQENRSFDQYFGTFPGADGLPVRNGQFPVCVPAPAAGVCVKPYHDSSDLNYGGPHGQVNATADINGGKMDGFIAEALKGQKTTCTGPDDPNCGGNGKSGGSDVMGYHDAREIPNYWTYAQDFVLQDHMFEPNASWSLPEHLFMVSEWSAKCGNATDPQSCVNALQNPGQGANAKYAWTDLTYLMYKNSVSWKYYVAQGTQPDCEDDQATCAAQPQTVGTPEIWNPLPWFTTVKQDGQLGNIQTIGNFYTDAKNGHLPAVSWVVPNGKVSEHPTALVSEGQTYVTTLINAIMNSPYAQSGYIDHQTLSFDAYLKFIEDDFLGGARLNPTTDGRPDPRPDVRESSPLLGNLVGDFDFSQLPRPPTPLPPCPQTTLTGVPSGCPYGSGG